MYYKLTDEHMKTYDETQWVLGKWNSAAGKTGQELCTNGWIHVYDSADMAALMNPIHANFAHPKLYTVETRGETKDDNGIKRGVREARLISEIPLPVWNATQRAAFAILSAQKVVANQTWCVWADDWLSGKDRTTEAAAEAGRMAATLWSAAAEAAVWTASAEQWAASAWVAAWAAAEAAKRTFIDFQTIIREAKNVRT